ncbi:MAG: hydroxyacid dehydrogenase, partial [Sciscionella sp.]
MTEVLAAGDHFIDPRLFVDALRDELGDAAELSFSTIRSDWPISPFGEVDGVLEASGSVAELQVSLAGKEVALTQMAPFTAEVFAAAPRLRFLGVCRGGPVNVDLD